MVCSNILCIILHRFRVIRNFLYNGISYLGPPNLGVLPLKWLSINKTQTRHFLALEHMFWNNRRGDLARRATCARWEENWQPPKRLTVDYRKFVLSLTVVETVWVSNGVGSKCDYNILESGDSIFMELRMREQINSAHDVPSIKNQKPMYSN